MDILEKINAFLQGFPLWQTPDTDTLAYIPEAVGLYPTGVTAVGIREDVLGNRIGRYRFTAILRRSATDGPGWALSLQQWLAQQALLGNDPKLGSNERITAGKGKKTGSDGAGTAFYEVELTVEYDYEVNENGEN